MRQQARTGRRERETPTIPPEQTGNRRSEPNDNVPGKYLALFICLQTRSVPWVQGGVKRDFREIPAQRETGSNLQDAKDAKDGTE